MTEWQKLEREVKHELHACGPASVGRTRCLARVQVIPMKDRVWWLQISVCGCVCVCVWCVLCVCVCCVCVCVYVCVCVCVCVCFNINFYWCSLLIRSCWHGNCKISLILWLMWKDFKSERRRGIGQNTTCTDTIGKEEENSLSISRFCFVLINSRLCFVLINSRLYFVLINSQ